MIFSGRFGFYELLQCLALTRDFNSLAYLWVHVEYYLDFCFKLSECSSHSPNEALNYYYYFFQPINSIEADIGFHKGPFGTNVKFS